MLISGVFRRKTWGQLRKYGVDHSKSKSGIYWKEFPVLAFSTCCVGKHFSMPFVGFFCPFFCQLSFPVLRFEFRVSFHPCVKPFFIYALCRFMLRFFFSSIVLRFISVIFSHAWLRSGNDNEGPQCNYATLCNRNFTFETKLFSCDLRNLIFQQIELWYLDSLNSNRGPKLRSAVREGKPVAKRTTVLPSLFYSKSRFFPRQLMVLTDIHEARSSNLGFRPVIVTFFGAFKGNFRRVYWNMQQCFLFFFIGSSG